MAIGTEFLTSNLNVAYPFQENALGLARTEPAVHGSSATLPPDFMVDAFLSLRSNALPLYLATIIPGVNSFTLTFVDILATVQLVVTVSTTGWLPTSTFEHVDVDYPAKGVYGKLVFYAPSALAYLADPTVSQFGLTLPLESTAAVPRNASVETFELYTVLPPVPDPDTPGPITGDVQLESGYNVATDLEAEDTGDVTDVSLSAVPQGQAPCEHEESEYIKGFMQLLPDENGNIQITNGDDECYAIIPLVPAQTFQIQGSCKACCSCDDYKNVATALERLMQRSKAALAVLTTAHNGPNGYTVGVNWFNQHIAPTYDGAKVVLVGQAGAQWCQDPAVRGGSLHLATLDLSIKNNTQYTMFITSITWNTAAMAPKVVMLRNWSMTEPEYYGAAPWSWITSHPYQNYVGPLDTVTYPVFGFTDRLRIGGEARHHLDIQIPYYEGAGITWNVEVTVSGQYFIIPPGPGPVTPAGSFTEVATATFS